MSLEQLQLNATYAEPDHCECPRGARQSESGPRAGDYQTASRIKEKPRRQATETRLGRAFGLNNHGPLPCVCARGPLSDCRVLVREGLPARPDPTLGGRCVGHCRWVFGDTASDAGRRPVRREREQYKEKERNERIENARTSLSGSCAGDYQTATTVKEKPRRQTTGTRLRVALGHSERGPRPPVCARDPLNDCRASAPDPRVRASHCTSISQRWRRRRGTCRKGSASDLHRRPQSGGICGTSPRRSAFR